MFWYVLMTPEGSRKWGKPNRPHRWDHNGPHGYGCARSHRGSVGDSRHFCCFTATPMELLPVQKGRATCCQARQAQCAYAIGNVPPCLLHVCQIKQCVLCVLCVHTQYTHNVYKYMCVCTYIYIYIMIDIEWYQYWYWYLNWPRYMPIPTSQYTCMRRQYYMSFPFLKSIFISISFLQTSRKTSTAHRNGVEWPPPPPPPSAARRTPNRTRAIAMMPKSGRWKGKKSSMSCRGGCDLVATWLRRLRWWKKNERCGDAIDEWGETNETNVQTTIKWKSTRSHAAFAEQSPTPLSQNAIEHGGSWREWRATSRFPTAALRHSKTWSASPSGF